MGSKCSSPSDQRHRAYDMHQPLGSLSFAMLVLVFVFVPSNANTGVRGIDSSKLSTSVSIFSGGTAILVDNEATGLIQSNRQRCQPTFVSVLSVGRSFTLSRPKDIHSLHQNTGIHPCDGSASKSSTALTFWSRTHQNNDILTPYKDSSRVDYKQSTDDLIANNGNGSNEKLQSNGGGIVLYNATNQHIQENNKDDTKNNVTSRLRRLAYLPVRALMLPPLLIPFLPSKSKAICIENATSMDQELVVEESTASDMEGDEVNHSSGIVLLEKNEEHTDLTAESLDATDDGQDSRSVEVEIETDQADSEESLQVEINARGDCQRKRRGFFKRRSRNGNAEINQSNPAISKEETTCPVIVTNIEELRDAVLINKVPLRNVGFRFPVEGVGSEVVLQNPNLTSTLVQVSKSTGADGKKGAVFQRYDPVINGTLSSLLTCNVTSSSKLRNSTQYQKGIELITHHPVLSLVSERIKTNSTPGHRLPEQDSSHLALVIEGGGMRGAVSAGMAAALSTLDLLDVFDSIHGSSAGAIVGAYLVSRQLCTDVYTHIMPAAGSKFASKKRGVINFGVDWLGDLIERKVLSSSEKSEDKSPVTGKTVTVTTDDTICKLVDEVCDVDIDGNGANGTAWDCDDAIPISSVELAMGRIRTKSRRRSRWLDDHYGEVMLESADYLLSAAYSKIARPLSFVVRKAGVALRPALSAFDFASSLRQYLKREPGMNLTYVLDGIMDETHGLRPFDMEAFRANDKHQPLYVVASTVSEGGSGEMETVAFNSKDGDFFGLSEDAKKDANSSENAAAAKWYKRMWNLFQRAPYALYSIVSKALFTSEETAIESPAEHTILPPGSSAMYGFANRRKYKRKMELEERYYEPTGRVHNEGKTGLFPCLEASMLVPAAAGAPIQLLRSKNRILVEDRNPNRRFPRFMPRRQGVLTSYDKQKEAVSHLCYDAFCYGQLVAFL